MRKAKYPVGEWFVRPGRDNVRGAGIVRFVDSAGDSGAEFPAGALHDCGGSIRKGFGEYLFSRGEGRCVRPATPEEIISAKAMFLAQGIDWRTGKGIEPKAKLSKPAFRWSKRDGLIDADSRQVVQLVPNYCTNKRRDEIGKILADALNKGES